MHALSAIPHLVRFRIPVRSMLACPSCKGSFVGEHGFAFLTNWQTRDADGNTGIHRGHLTFCSTTCILHFVDHAESGHA